MYNIMYYSGKMAFSLVFGCKSFNQILLEVAELQYLCETQDVLS